MILKLGKIEWERRTGQQKKRWLDSIIDSMDMNLSKLLRDSKEQGRLVCCNLWALKELDMT